MIGRCGRNDVPHGSLQQNSSSKPCLTHRCVNHNKKWNTTEFHSINSTVLYVAFIHAHKIWVIVIWSFRPGSGCGSTTLMYCYVVTSLSLGNDSLHSKTMLTITSSLYAPKWTKSVSFIILLRIINHFFSSELFIFITVPVSFKFKGIFLAILMIFYSYIYWQNILSISSDGSHPC
jgi:hypothetical protein